MKYFTVKEPGGSLLTIRDIETRDLAAVTAIYNHYVLNTVVTFDIKAFDVTERHSWLSQFSPDTPHQCLVIENDAEILGYASSSKFRPKPAYDQTVETTIYLKPGAGGRGLGTLLYQRLVQNLLHQPVHLALGIVALPNPQSLKLHENCGFEVIGKLSEVGFKFGSYHDTLLLQKHLGDR